MPIDMKAHQERAKRWERINDRALEEMERELNRPRWLRIIISVWPFFAGMAFFAVGFLVAARFLGKHLF